MYGIPDKYLKVISAMSQNNAVVEVEVENELGCFGIESGVQQCCVLAPFILSF